MIVSVLIAGDKGKLVFPPIIYFILISLFYLNYIYMQYKVFESNIFSDNILGPFLAIKIVFLFDI